MRPWGLLGFRLMLTGHSLSQVCIDGGIWLVVYIFSCNLLWVVYTGKSQRGKLVNWVEKASLGKIRKLLEILEQERHY